jgi:serine/threonine protein kinase
MLNSSCFQALVCQSCGELSIFTFTAVCRYQAGMMQIRANDLSACMIHEDSRLWIIYSNIMLDESMNLKISDFGLARLVGGSHT